MEAPGSRRVNAGRRASNVTMFPVDQQQLEAAADTLRGVLSLIDEGGLDATDIERAYVAGALAATQEASRTAG